MHELSARGLTAGFFLGAAILSQALAADRPVVNIGILTEMPGTDAAMGEPGSVAAAKWAIQNCLAAECTGMPTELMSADNQNKTDIGTAKTREWFDWIAAIPAAKAFALLADLIALCSSPRASALGAA